MQYIITDACLLHGLYYNEHNPDNVSNVDKTKDLILSSYNKFRNINLFIERGDFEYETIGRIQTQEESKYIDVKLKNYMNELHLNYCEFVSTKSNIENIIKYIELYTEIYENLSNNDISCQFCEEKINGNTKWISCKNCYNQILCFNCNEKYGYCKICLENDKKINSTYFQCKQCKLLSKKKVLDDRELCNECFIKFK